ncbi:MAG: hypothetical protein FWC01_05525 [Treponema sp.]|nr:hypothetical protein [Treponema sp.]MCL2237391.1 hypothetical protein [Treponema sp.]
MKKNIFYLLIILILTVSISISCTSTDKATTDETQAGSAASAVERARQRAIDFDCPAYFPSDWEALEGRYQAAENAAARNALASEYDDLFNKTVPLYAQAREDEITAMREQVIRSGFTDYFPEYLAKADEIALGALAKYEAQDYYGAKDAADAAQSEYETLLMGSRIFTARQEIVDRGFSQFDADNFLRADEVAQTAIDAYDAGDRDAAVARGEEALLRYNLVLSNGWVAYSSVRRDAAVAEREAAIAERANIASRELFRDAEGIFTHAEEDLANENYSSAGLGFVEAEAKFAIARVDANDKRQRAEAAIRRAEERVGASNETAIEAERIIEGGSR